MKNAKNRKNVSAVSRDHSRGSDDRRKRKEIANEVKLYLEDAGITRPQLEEMVNRGKSTMDHFFAGGFSEGLLKRVEHALSRNFGRSSAKAPPEWGGYAHEATAEIVGSYLTLRNDFKDPDAICAYVTTIEWSTIEHAYIFDGQVVQKPKIDGFGLIFREERRFDSKYTHRGQVWMPGGQYLYLVSAYGDGRLRAAIASRPDKGKMTGIQLSLYNPRGAAFTPAATPVAFVRREGIDEGELGYLKPGHSAYDGYLELLQQAAADVVFALPRAYGR